MNKGFRSWARPRNRVFVGEPQTINTTSGNTFRHAFGHVPGIVEVRLVCTTANNGYLVGEEIPFESVMANDGNNDDGGPYRLIRINHLNVLVWHGAGTYAFFPANLAPVLANIAAFNSAQWKILVRCRDIERLT